MTRIRGIICLLLLSSIFTNCTALKGKPFGFSGSAFRTNVMDGGLKWFGFYPGSVSPGDSIDEQRGFVNFTSAAEPGRWADKAVANGMRIIFLSPGIETSDAEFSDWVASVRPYSQSLLAFYLMDEPDCAAGGNQARFEKYINDIEATIIRLKTRFPNVPTVMTTCNSFLSYHPTRYPRGLDIVAVETYGTLSDWQSSIAAAKTLMNESQKLMLLPAGNLGMGSEEVLIQKADQIYQLALDDSRVIGLWVFDWYTDPTSPGVDRGTRDLPSVRAKFEQMGRTIIGSTPPPPNPTPPPNPNPTPPAQPPPTGNQQTCPVDSNGVDGLTVCSAWRFDHCNGYEYYRTRTCDPNYACRTTDWNGPGTPLNYYTGPIYWCGWGGHSSP